MSQPADDAETTLCADLDAAPGGTHQAPMYVDVSSLSSFQHLINGHGCSSLPAPMDVRDPDQTSDKSDGPWSGYDMWGHQSYFNDELCFFNDEHPDDLRKIFEVDDQHTVRNEGGLDMC